MLLNTKGDIMKKKKKLIKVVVILLVTAIVAGTVFIWKSHKAKAAAAAATAENIGQTLFFYFHGCSSFIHGDITLR